ncbi:MAG TPA: BON domain-containing protein [Blastocatellia bacterium]|nr:BON domain-containing protein [Blastocatellia bacterium]
MKRILIIALALCLATSPVWAQNKITKPAKAKPAPVDCPATTDAQITDNVKAKLAGTPSLKDQTINVATSAGVVTLTGKVKTSSSKGVATRMAKSVACVKKVNNKCEAEVKTVPPKASKKNAKPKNSM